MTEELARGESIIVLESGSYSSKLGYADSQEGPSKIVNFERWLKKGKSRPVVNGQVNGYDVLGEYWMHLLTDDFDLRRSLSETPIVLSFPMSMSHRSTMERCTQILFENLESPAAYICHQPLMALYACGVVSGLVIDIGHSLAHITPVLDSNIQYHANASLYICPRECDSKTGLYLMGESDHIELIQRIVLHIHTTTRCFEAEKQQLLLDHMVLTGGGSLVPEFQTQLSIHLTNYLAISEYPSDHQPRSARFLKIPDYFAKLKGKNEHASWFGASMIARLVFSDPKNFMSRADYNEHGPVISWEKSY